MSDESIELWIKERKPVWGELKKQYPHGIQNNEIGHESIRCAVSDDKRYVCMSCGTTMLDYSQKKHVKGEWVDRKSKGNYSQWYCPNCKTTKPILAGMGLRGNTLLTFMEYKQRQSVNPEKYPLNWD